MDDETRADRCAEIMDNIIEILSPTFERAPIQWYGYDNDTEIMHIHSKEVTNDSEYFIEYRCVGCGKHQVLSARAFLFILKQADIKCPFCKFTKQDGEGDEDGDRDDDDFDASHCKKKRRTDNSDVFN